MNCGRQPEDREAGKYSRVFFDWANIQLFPQAAQLFRRFDWLGMGAIIPGFSRGRFHCQDRANRSAELGGI
jgi:hypothetical protein